MKIHSLGRTLKSYLPALRESVAEQSERHHIEREGSLTLSQTCQKPDLTSFVRSDSIGKIRRYNQSRLLGAGLAHPACSDATSTRT